jgi:hypothetical protein
MPMLHQHRLSILLGSGERPQTYGGDRRKIKAGRRRKRRCAAAIGSRNIAREPVRGKALRQKYRQRTGNGIRRSSAPSAHAS